MYSKFGKLMGVISAAAMGIFCAMPAMAQEAAVAAEAAAPAAAPVSSGLSTQAVYALAAALCLALAAFAGAFAQGNALAKAMEGIARNPEASGKMQTLLLIGLAFIESLSIYALVISFMLIGKL